MGSLSEEDDPFFDSKEYVTPVSDSGSDGLEFSDAESRAVKHVVRNIHHKAWMQRPGTFNKRRQNLLRLMGLAQNDAIQEDKPESSDKFEDATPVIEQSMEELRSSFREVRSSSQSSVSSISRCSSDTLEFIVDEFGQNGLSMRLREVGSDLPMSGEHFQRTLGLSPLGQSEMRGDFGVMSNKPARNQRAKKGWRARLGVVSRVADITVGGINHDEAAGFLPIVRHQTPFVKVRTYRKQSKEFSALYMGEDILAHKGAILTMKFNPEGQFLASAGEDGIVRIWQVIESKRSDLVHIPDVDSSHVYFAANHLGELEPVAINKAKRGRLRSLRKSWESACVIFPQNVFQLTEEPLHEFHGHGSEVLDLSWSNSKCLLSSSADNTVRLWRVGFEECLKVFSHNSFVTSVQFNPIVEDYFISGSIDGKVRIWSISRCEVVDWTDLKEIVAAVCYKPDGKEAVVGSITGDCYFYDTSDNHLQMTNQTSVHGKKKTPHRRITGFQFSPGDPSKLMVTTAGSQVRLLEGVDVICKYKGLRNAGSQMSTAFSSDGARVISASEDSYVNVWGPLNTDGADSSRGRRKMSCERFFSNDASVAIPWCGTLHDSPLSCLSATSPVNQSEIMVRYPTENGLEDYPPISTDSSSRKVATWPAEELTSSNYVTVSSTTSKSEFMALKTTCQNMAGSTHAWGSVIVTAGWDGRIRVFQNFGLPAQ